MADNPLFRSVSTKFVGGSWDGVTRNVARDVLENGCQIHVRITDDRVETYEPNFSLEEGWQMQLITASEGDNCATT